MIKANSSNAHLFFSSPFRGKSINNLFMTHPPVEERIKALMGMKI
jgi:heat shock protein HtpX